MTAAHDPCASALPNFDKRAGQVRTLLMIVSAASLDHLM
jgi:hypothetical protein